MTRLLLAVLLLFASGVISSPHVAAHFADSTIKAPNLVTFVDSDAQAPGNSDSSPLGGLEHHFCTCACVGAVQSRVSQVMTYPEGTRVRYAGYLGESGAFGAPDPLRKPPRSVASA